MSVDFSTFYLGMKLKNPLGVSACPPLTGNVPMLRRLEDAGASLVVLPSLFEEQIEHEEAELEAAVRIPIRFVRRVADPVSGSWKTTTPVPTTTCSL